MIKKLTVIICSLILLSSCNNENKKLPEIKKEDTIRSIKIETKDQFNWDKYDHAYNNMSRYIAGLAKDSGSAFPQILTKAATWKKYSDVANAEWKKVDSIRLLKMDDWAKAELENERKNTKTIFYPFSGPDALHVITFFPNAKNYYLFALESLGSFPSFEKMDTATANNYINTVQNSLEDVFDKSYFITRKMMNDLSKTNVNGSTPLICLFLVRTDHKILNLKYYHLKGDGSYEETTIDSLKSFVKIDFIKNNSETPRSIYYFRTNLENKPYAKNIALQGFLNKLDSFDTYLKSASYLLHYKTFSTIKDYILARSGTVLEDDTGIPFSSFDPKIWHINLYGKYVKPVRDFSGVYQKDLQAEYERSPSKQKLPFSLGYHWGDKNQNLIKATRK